MSLTLTLVEATTNLFFERQYLKKSNFKSNFFLSLFSFVLFSFVLFSFVLNLCSLKYDFPKSNWAPSSSSGDQGICRFVKHPSLKRFSSSLFDCFCAISYQLISFIILADIRPAPLMTSSFPNPNLFRFIITHAALSNMTNHKGLSSSLLGLTLETTISTGKPSSSCKHTITCVLSYSRTIFCFI